MKSIALIFVGVWMIVFGGATLLVIVDKGCTITIDGTVHSIKIGTVEK